MKLSKRTKSRITKLFELTDQRRQERQAALESGDLPLFLDATRHVIRAEQHLYSLLSGVQRADGKETSL